MRPLMRFLDGVMANALAQALEAEEIAARVTNERGNAYLGAMEFVVWVTEEADAIALETVCRSVRSQQGEIVLPPTRVSASDDMIKCRKCGYDLRGQTADGKCPECGHPYRIVGVTVCRKCGAEMPSNFTVCWKCNGDVVAFEN